MSMELMVKAMKIRVGNPLRKLVLIKLADNASDQGARFGPGQAIVTPAVIKGELLATYRQLERAGIVENYELFKQYLVVERDASEPKTHMRQRTAGSADPRRGDFPVYLAAGGA